MSPTAGVQGTAGERRGGRLAVSVWKQTGDYLAELAEVWPVGGRVRHATSGWAGTVTVDASGQAPAITNGPKAAHGLLFEPPYTLERGVPAVVCVVWDRGDAATVGPAWMRVGHLAHLDPDQDGADDQDPGQDAGRRWRTRTRRRGAADTVRSA